MPGVLTNSQSGVQSSREVGKMASFMHPDLMTLNSDDESTDLEDIASRLFGVQSSSMPFGLIDSDGELPDDEHTIDLLKYLDGNDELVGFDLDNLKCDGDCNDCGTEAPKYTKYRVSSNQDPFMGMVQQKHGDKSTPFTWKNTLLGQIMDPLDDDTEQSSHQQKAQQQSFSAWNHTVKTEDETETLMLTKSSMEIHDEEAEEIAFPDTLSPSSQSGTVTGDDSDVDIETITDIPRAADSCGYVTQDSSTPSISPAASPAALRGSQSGSLVSILPSSNRSSSSCSSPSSNTSSPDENKTIHFNSYGVSSSVSLAENLMSGRSSMFGHKRKLSKEKKHHHEHRSSLSSQPAYTHILCNSNSVNFHDYAMSPGACNYPSTSSSIETARPTVLSKRTYKRKHNIAMDATEKEKQHHHNQLERNRRQKLADLFVYLRDEVPTISNQSKASKVMILSESTAYIRELQRLERQQEDEMSRELLRKESLLKQLQDLEESQSRINMF